MKRIFFTAALLVGLTGAQMSFAADIPVKAPAAAPVWTWAGLYLGGHAGGVWAKAHWLSNSRAECAGFTTQCDPVNGKPSSLVAGGQGGYRWQSGAFVYGLEGTFAVTSLRKVICSGVGGCNAVPGGGPDYPFKLNPLVTATAQLGYAWDRTLLYVKGGYAGASLTTTRTNGTTGGGGTDWANGWTVGAGLEYLYTRNISFAIEYDYVDFRPRDNVSCPAGTVFSTCAPPLRFSDIKVNLHQVVGRVNVKVDWGALVAARY